MNGYQGQILASDQTDKCFKQGQDLFIKINNKSKTPINYIQSIGIQAPPQTKVFLNNQLIKIGEYGLLQLSNVKITSIVFDQNTDSSVKIDYIIHK